MPREETIARHQPVDRDDLYLLLESYKTTVELNTTLLERQEKINTDQQTILADLMGLCTTQNNILTELKKLPDSMNEAIERLCSATGSKCDDIKSTVGDIEGALTVHHTEQVKENGSLKNHIYVALVGTALIIVALLGTLAQIWPKGGPAS